MPAIYVCVYRHPVPSRLEWAHVESAEGALMAEWRAAYQQPGSVLDWGDDPSFFGASRLLGSASLASWSVCRRDVRSSVRPGDAVVFVNACYEWDVRRRPTGAINYAYTGVATVSRTATREEVWSDPSLEPYRSFFNALARPSPDGLVNVEVFPPHDDWELRAGAPVVFFDPKRTCFDLDSPRIIARHERGQPVPEAWSADPASQRLEALLFADTPRRLRTSNAGYAHAKRVVRLEEPAFHAVVDELLDIARDGPESSLRDA